MTVSAIHSHSQIKNCTHLLSTNTIAIVVAIRYIYLYSTLEVAIHSLSDLMIEWIAT